MDIYNPIQTKICKKCGIDKPLSEFNNCKSNKDGYQRKCRLCEKEYYNNNKKSILNRTKEYNSVNKESKTEYHRQYYIENKERFVQYQQNNKSKRNIREKNRRYNNTTYKLRCDISNLIRGSIKRKGFSKTTKTANILGCDWDTLKEHIENQFDSNMNWNNHGTYWDIDHIIPVSSAKTEDDIIRLNHYTNLQPLESNYNRYVKRDKTIIYS